MGCSDGVTCHAWHSSAAKTHCKRGHEFTAENTRMDNGGKSRRCRQCERERCDRRSANRIPAPPRTAMTHCKKGHPFDQGNTYVNPNTGGRECKTCRDARMRGWLERRHPMRKG